MPGTVRVTTAHHPARRRRFLLFLDYSSQGYLQSLHTECQWIPTAGLNQAQKRLLSAISTDSFWVPVLAAPTPPCQGERQATPRP